MTTDKEIIAKYMEVLEENPELKDLFLKLEDENELLTGQSEVLLALNECLEEKSAIDGVTRLFNKNYFNEIFPVECQRAARKETEISLIMIDMDGYKRYNDTYGHAAGDTLLRGIADEIKQYVRNIDIVCRYGGDEYAVILPYTNMDRATEVAERIRKGIEKLQCGVTLSLGVASYKGGKEDSRNKNIINACSEVLFKMADDAMYQAKGEGKNRFCKFAYPLE